MVSQSTMLLMASIGALILTLALLILLHENASATRGYRLRGLDRDRTLLLLEQEVLNMRRAEAQSIRHLQQDPQIQSMAPVKNPRYVHADANEPSSASSAGGAPAP